MNAWYSWVNSAAAKALGWSLIHFLWEGALIALVLAVVLRFSRTEAARFRYACCCLALLAMPLALGLTVLALQPDRPVELRATHHLTLAPAPGPDAETPAAATASGNAWAGLPWVAPLWMTGVLLFALRSLGSWMMAQRLRRSGVCAATAEWHARVRRLGGRLGLSAPVNLLESCRVDVPMVMGLFRPVILMPMGLLAGLSTDQLESILLHELAHIRRRDYVINLLQSLVEGLLFYHPAVWWVSAGIRAERENCCDDVVVALNGDARGYAAALARLEQSRWPSREPAMAATGGSLMLRIRRLLRQPEEPRPSTAPVFAAGLLVVSVGVAVAGWQVKPTATPQRSIGPQLFTDSQPVAHPATVPERHPVTAPPLLVQVQAVQEQVPVAQPETEPQRRLRLLAQKVKNELDTPYRKWLNEDVAYIISDGERSAFKLLTTDAEREQFIENFWLRRDPTPGTLLNEMREEHYRRIAYTNEHFSAGIPGWKTDRGRVYISYGPPDQIESHPSGGKYERPAEQGGGTTTTFPFEQWRYQYIQDVGNDVVIEFVDSTGNGEYHMTMDPSEKDALLYLPGQRQSAGRSGASVQIMGTARADGQKTVLLSVPLGAAYASHKVEIVGRITTMTRSPVMDFTNTIQGPWPLLTRFISLAPGTYRLGVVVKDLETGQVTNDDLTVEVK